LKSFYIFLIIILLFPVVGSVAKADHGTESETEIFHVNRTLKDENIIDEEVAAVLVRQATTDEEFPQIRAIMLIVPQNNVLVVKGLFDKFITFVNDLNVYGSVSNDIKAVRLNGKDINIKNGRQFRTIVPLNYGKNTMLFEVDTNDGETILAKYRILRLIAYVKEFGYSREAMLKQINKERYGVTLIASYLDEYLEPAYTVNRGEMAKIIANMYQYEIIDVRRNVYKDVSNLNEYAPFINACKRMRIINGYPDGTYRPFNKLKISEFAAFVTEADGLNFSGNKEWYKIKDRSYWAQGNLLAVKKEKIMDLPHIANIVYYRRPVTIKTIVDTFYKTSKMKEKEEWLIDWERGY